MKIKQRGFTLIELLVVIAIIGLLSTMAVVSLNSARGKARDARRVSDVKQLSTILEMEASKGETTTVKTGAAPGTAAPADTLIKNVTLPGDASQFSNFQDPSDTTDTACNTGCSAVCEYAISNNTTPANGATVGDYQICFYLEQGSGDLGAACHSIESGSRFGTCD